eukprot:747397-Hanusia_phi.AAC.1
METEGGEEEGGEEGADWREVVDEETGMVYYWNVRSNTTTWDPPPCWIEKDPEEGSSRWGEGEEDREEDMEVQRVMQGFEVDPPAATSCTTAAAAAAASSTMVATSVESAEIEGERESPGLFAFIILHARWQDNENVRDDIRTRQEIYPGECVIVFTDLRACSDLKRCKNPFISQSVQHRPDECEGKFVTDCENLLP